jgi:hypothetical protein
LATELNRSFSKEEIQVAKKHMKKCSPSLVIKEMQIKTTLRFHLTPVRIVIIKNTTTTCVGKDVGKKEPSYTAGGNASWCNQSEKKFGGFIKILNIDLPYDPAIPL